MKYYELKIKVILSEDMEYTKTSYKIGVFINNSMLNNKLLKKLHEERFYKYVYDTFYPLEKDGVYKKGKYYTFRLRSINIQLLNKMAMAIYNHEYFGIKAVDVDLHIKKVEKIEQLFAIKPVIITVDNKPWLEKNNSIDIMKCKLNDNLSKKLKQFEGEEFLEEPIDFIDSIEIINRKPAKYSYKNVTLLGNKLNIKVKSDELSQKKALMAIALGLGEKGSSLGAGFCNYI